MRMTDNKEYKAFKQECRIQIQQGEATLSEILDMMDQIYEMGFYMGDAKGYAEASHESA